LQSSDAAAQDAPYGRRRHTARGALAAHSGHSRAPRPPGAALDAPHQPALPVSPDGSLAGAAGAHGRTRPPAAALHRTPGRDPLLPAPERPLHAVAGTRTRRGARRAPAGAAGRGARVRRRAATPGRLHAAPEHWPGARRRHLRGAATRAAAAVGSADVPGHPRQPDLAPCAAGRRVSGGLGGRPGRRPARQPARDVAARGGTGRVRRAGAARFSGAASAVSGRRGVSSSRPRSSMRTHWFGSR